MANRSSGKKIIAIVKILSTPRNITLIFLILAGSALGFLFWKYLPEKVIAWASGIAAPFCTMCATLVWASREKIDDLLDPQSLTPDEYEKLSSLSNSHRIRSLLWASSTMLFALIASIPAIAFQFDLTINKIMVVFSGAAVGSSIYSYLLANSWDEQARRFKTNRILIAMRRIELNELTKDLEKSAAQDDELLSSIGRGWQQGPTLGPERRA